MSAMTYHNLCYYPCTSFTNAVLPLLKVAALCFDRPLILDPVGVSWPTIDADQHDRGSVNPMHHAGILERVTSADILSRDANSIAGAVRRVTRKD